MAPRQGSTGGRGAGGAQPLRAAPPAPMSVRARAAPLLLLFASYAGGVPAAGWPTAADRLLVSFGRGAAEATTEAVGAADARRREGGDAAPPCARAALVSIEGKGTHRKARFRLRRMLGGHARGEHCHADCAHAAVALPLPPGVYADDEEIKRLKLPASVAVTHVRSQEDACVLGEAHAALCKASLVVLTWDVVVAAALERAVDVAVPIHARYPQAKPNATVATYVIAPPKALVRCKREDEWNIASASLVSTNFSGGDGAAPAETHGGSLLWHVHAADAMHRAASHDAAATTTLLGSAVIVFAALRARVNALPPRKRKRA